MAEQPAARQRRRAGYTGTYKVLGDFELPPDESDRAERHIAAADAERSGTAVTLRWGRRQLAIVRRAASLYGLPYQAYVKEAAFRRAVADLEQAARARVEGADVAVQWLDEGLVRLGSTAPYQRGVVVMGVGVAGGFSHSVLQGTAYDPSKVLGGRVSGWSSILTWI